MGSWRSPLIGITTHSRNESGEFSLPRTYIDAVRLAGGSPLLIPPNQPDPGGLLERLDGLIFSGGGDLAPDLYGGIAHHTIYLVDEERDQFEMDLAQRALSADIPVLGICRGMQVLTVASGGDLIAHVPEAYGTQVIHRLEHPRRPCEHAVELEADTRLVKILGTTFTTVVSWHHQAVKTIPQDWRAIAYAEDGLIEAMEHQQHPWMIAVQWHPELSPVSSVHARLFAALVEATQAVLPR